MVVSFGEERLIELSRYFRAFGPRAARVPLVMWTRGESLKLDAARVVELLDRGIGCMATVELVEQRHFRRQHRGLPYRPEIDGLRAIAVLPVVLFHAGFEAFGGGFVGVDVFFVISGYLITSIIVGELATNEFTVLNFYERRARRILPALFVVAAASTVAGWRILPPDQLVDFGRSLTATSLFYSNFYFLSQTGYFAPASEHLPLLHTWSLAVEEQFYILFPPILMALYASQRSRVAFLLALLGLVSLVFAEWTSRVEPEVAFFSSHTRAFELLSGAVLALTKRQMAGLDLRLRNIFAWWGLVTCLASFHRFGTVSIHPGVATLLPIVGTLLLIAFASSDNLPGRLLSWRPLVAIGLISYSLYLWHQPVFAFTRIYLAREVTPLEMVAPTALCFLLAALTWRFVERPIRSARAISRNTVFFASVMFVVLPVAAGVTYVRADGFPVRMGHEAIAVLDRLEEASKVRSAGVRSASCHFITKSGNFDEFFAQWNCLPEGGAGVLVYGDSHAADKAWALRSAGVMVGSLTGTGCPLKPVKTRPECLSMMRRVIDLGQQGLISGIILANRWDVKELEGNSLSQIEQFWRQAGVPVLLFTGMPEFTHMREQVARRLMRNEDLSGLKFDVTKLSATNRALGSAFNGGYITLVHTERLFCQPTQDGCQAFDGRQPLLIDYGHLAPLGAQRFGHRLVSSPTWQMWASRLRTDR